jgi:hypothetical protein
MRQVTRTPRWLWTALVAVAFAGPASADELAMPANASQSASRPARGMSMEKVEAAYGSPSRRVPAVGTPPITRWEYPGFVVYFEHNIVIHSVAVG